MQKHIHKSIKIDKLDIIKIQKTYYFLKDTVKIM